MFPKSPAENDAGWFCCELPAILHKKKKTQTKLAHYPSFELASKIFLIFLTRVRYTTPTTLLIIATIWIWSAATTATTTSRLLLSSMLRHRWLQILMPWQSKYIHSILFAIRQTTSNKTLQIERKIVFGLGHWNRHIWSHFVNKSKFLPLLHSILWVCLKTAPRSLSILCFLLELSLEIDYDRMAFFRINIDRILRLRSKHQLLRKFLVDFYQRQNIPVVGTCIWNGNKMFYDWVNCAWLCVRVCVCVGGCRWVCLNEWFAYQYVPAPCDVKSIPWSGL